ncbi:MAG: HAD-IIIC family phosphatase, partial [Myxococcales bacterium]|nr:HAD-IIIC family phosphatase [Myxococcales bacterium]
LAEPSPALARLATTRRLDAEGDESFHGKARVHVVRNVTVDALADQLRFEGYQRKLRVDTTLSGYDPFSAAFDDAAQAAVHGVDVAFVWLSLDAMREAFVDGRLSAASAFAQVERLAQQTLDAGAKRVVLATFVPPIGTGVRYRDAGALYELNGQIVRLAESSPRLGLCDVARIAACLGDDASIDRRFWTLFEAPFSQALCSKVAASLTATLAESAGLAKKVIVVDADNTLWRGVVGEDGVAGIAMAATDPAGRPFQAFQRQLGELRKAGVILAMASKNERADVHGVFETRPEMALRRADFAAERIDWNDKAENIESIAKELGLGLDSFVFIDDSDVECARVREALPMVDVLQVPPRAHDLPFLLGRYLGFAERATSEDRARAADYAAEKSRRDEAGKHADLASFVASLEVVVAVASVDTSGAARAAQLCQRTNQFNLTTRRYDVADIEKAIDDREALVLSADVADRFGAQGVTGLAIVRAHEGRVAIDSFMLSCRVLGRRIELAFLAEVVDRARARFGNVAIIGEHRPTAKNGQTRTFFESAGFAKIDESSERVLFELPASGCVIAPSYLTLDRRP